MNDFIVHSQDVLKREKEERHEINEIQPENKTIQNVEPEKPKKLRYSHSFDLNFIGSTCCDMFRDSINFEYFCYCLHSYAPRFEIGSAPSLPNLGAPRPILSSKTKSTEEMYVFKF
jgi:hypothetical protein